MFKKNAKQGRRSLSTLILAAVIALLLVFPPAVFAVTTGNGALVYAPNPATTFDNAGTTYA